MAKNKNLRKRRRNRNKNYSSGNTSWRTWVKRFLIGSGLIILLAIVFGGGLFAYYASSAPELSQEDLQSSYSSELVDRNGDVFYTLGDNNRERGTAEEFPQVLKDAVLGIEDQRFYEHDGVDPIGIARAAGGFLANMEIVSGGSTITQQLIKLSVFSTSQDDQTLERKAQEAWLSTQLENELSKEQILTLYLNKVHMGGNVYGMATAAQEYYGKQVSELELHEAAMLAGMPKAPNYYNPVTNPNEAKNRRDTVLYSMVEYGAITEQQAQQAYQVPVDEGLQEPSSGENQNSLVYDGYITTVLQEVEEKTGLNPYTAGLTIHTNMDPEAQQTVYDVTHDQSIVQYPNEEMQTASTVIDNETGQLLAVGGGRHIEGQLSNNRATDMRRGVGSAIKPLTTYGPAIEYLNYSTHHQVVDEPYTVPGTDWELQNWDNEYNGQMSIREALRTSRNIPTAKIFNEDLNMSDAEQFLGNIGINAQNLSSGSGGLVPSNAINGTLSPMQLAGAYSAFASGGTYTEPHAVNTVVTQDGEEMDLTPESNQAMSDSTAYMITDILKGVAEDYYSSSLNVPGLIHAGKTGTTNYTQEQMQEYNIPSGGVPDSWFAGYSPNITMSVWAGYDQPYQENRYLHNDDGTRQIPRDVYREFMTRYTEGQETQDWQQPDSVNEEEVVEGSSPAEQASSSTPASEIVTELFVEGNGPIPPQNNSQDEENEDSEDGEDNNEESQDDPEGNNESNEESESSEQNSEQNSENSDDSDNSDEQNNLDESNPSEDSNNEEDNSSEENSNEENEQETDQGNDSSEDADNSDNSTEDNSGNNQENDSSGGDSGNDNNNNDETDANTQEESGDSGSDNNNNDETNNNTQEESGDSGENSDSEQSGSNGQETSGNSNEPNQQNNNNNGENSSSQSSDDAETNATVPENNQQNNQGSSSEESENNNE